MALRPGHLDEPRPRPRPQARPRPDPQAPQGRKDQEAIDAAAAAKAEQDALDAEQLAKLLAARAHNDTLHPCHTCKGPLGGAHGSTHELDENADPEQLECPACDHQRRRDRGRPILLDLPSDRDRRKAKRDGPPKDDPWWTVRLIHADRWTKADRKEGNIPLSM